MGVKYDYSIFYSIKSNNRKTIEITVQNKKEGLKLLRSLKDSIEGEVFIYKKYYGAQSSWNDSKKENWSI